MANAMVRTERLGLSWAYWEFGTDFGSFGLDANDWRPALRRPAAGLAPPC
ncbi:hypothetical protein [Actinomadura alba]|uniref:Uncharacterized protein n=1 Tax=Actinomadura alba TaxID=406431 RepID=A0ABR7LSN9_9ACTN|nr:hypothetical protein [Actinomadura alba]MBC6467869.1 hypothetical protein [Actinomadura alba]